jgi:hypothetical protein
VLLKALIKETVCLLLPEVLFISADYRNAPIDVMQHFVH